MTQIFITIDLIMSYNPCYHPVTGQSLLAQDIMENRIRYVNEGYLPEDYREPIDRFTDHHKIPEKDKLWLLTKMMDYLYPQDRIGTEKITSHESIEAILHEQGNKVFIKIMEQRRLDRERNTTGL